jgi:hypothetical protein
MDTDLRAAFQAVADGLQEKRPSVGKRVKVTGGRKYLGLEGEVFWHGIDKYDRSGLYMTSEQKWMTQAAGRLGYRVGVKTDEGEKFFVAADKVEVIGK